MKKDLYFKELALALGRNGFTPLPQENNSLPVEYQGRRLCRINDQSNVFYRQEEVNLPEREQALAKVTDMAGTVLEYMNHLEHAPTIQAMGLSEPYQALAEFNGTVLAGWQTEKGAKFVTWDWDFNHTGLNHGHYYEGNYVGAKRDFAIRSGLIPDERQFTTEQLIEIYQQSAYIRFSCSLPEEQERTIDTIQQRIQELVPDREERMTHSTSPCTQKIGRPTAMWPAAGPLPSQYCPCWREWPHPRRCTSVWTTTRPERRAVCAWPSRLRSNLISPQTGSSLSTRTGTMTCAPGIRNGMP